MPSFTAEASTKLARSHGARATRSTALRDARRLPFALARVLVVVAFCGFAIFPLYWALVNALQTQEERYKYPPGIFPAHPTLEAFRSVWKSTGIGHWLLNTLIVATLTAVLTLAMAISGAYAISRWRTRGTSLVTFLTLATQMIPPVVIMLPLFKVFVSLHLVNSLWGLVIADLFWALPVDIWILKSVFDAVPAEIEEAARVDGCNRLEVLLRITLPMAKSGILAAGIFAFITAWEEFLLTRLLVTTESKWVGSIGIASFFGEYGTNWPGVMAASLMFAVPPIILFMLVQRHFVEGFAGGVKG
jgi:multiple sugar transport system permease protein